MLCPTALSCKPQPCRSPAARKNPTLLLLHHSACFHTAQPNHCAWDLMPELHTVLKEGSMGQSWPPGGDRRDPSPSSHAPAEHCCSTWAVQGELYHCTSQEHPCSKAPAWQEPCELFGEQGEAMQQKARPLVLSPKHSQEINRSTGSLLQSQY